MAEHQKISELDEKTTVADTDQFAIMDEEATPDKTKRISGANMKSQMVAGHKDLTTGVHGAGANTIWHGGITDAINKTHLSQDFGASGGRLRNLIATPIAGYMLSIANCSGSPFSGLIDDNAGAHGGQGLDATHVPYDNDVLEDMFNNLAAYDGSAYWGQIILHNTTRSNSRKIVSVDRTNNVIATTSSTDDWANNDVVTCQSQTNASAGYVDLDLSDFIGTGVDAIVMFTTFRNNVASASALNVLYFHPYTTYDAGKRQWAVANLASDHNANTFLMQVITQKITFYVRADGTDDFSAILSVKGLVEFADT